MKNMSELEWAAWGFVVLGAVNWGLVGAFGFDLLMTVLGTSPMLVRVVYILIGLSGLYTLSKMMTMKK